MKKSKRKILMAYPKGRAIPVSHTYLESGPKLVLALGIDQPVIWKPGGKMITHLPRYFRFKEANLFKAISHQTSGLMCDKKDLWIMELKPRPAIASLMELVAKEYYDSCMGFAGVPLEEVNNYNSVLKTFGVGCNISYRDLAEGIYPVDVEHLKKMTSTKLPADLDDLLAFRTSIGKILGSLGRWRLYILVENSD